MNKAVSAASSIVVRRRSSCLSILHGGNVGGRPDAGIQRWPSARPISKPRLSVAEPARARAGRSAVESEESGGPKGKEPTRYGDWENNGICLGLLRRQTPSAAERPRQQPADHLVHRRLLRQQGADRGDDRHVDAERVGGALQHRRGEGALGDGPAVGEQVGRARALADALAEAEIARAGRGAGEDEVAEPGEARPASRRARPWRGRSGSSRRSRARSARRGRCGRACAPRPRRRRWRARS